MGMRQISEWLEAIGLAKYQTVFADNEIDWSLLPKLTERLGHRLINFIQMRAAASLMSAR